MIDLSNVAPLMAAWTGDPWGKLRPPVSVEAVEMSALLAQATYRMDVDAWVAKGWRDVTLQVDGDLTDGVEPGEKNGMQRLASAWKMFRVRQKIRGGNPLGEVMGALRQREKSDTGKAVVMIHPAGLGRYVVAISFMGTGERLYDWLSNFRMTAEEGAHKGFLQLTRQFEDNEAEIDFPETARELGLEKLTLRHVLEEMRHPNSRFVLWLSGHSQGAAVMQLYAHHKMVEDGVLPRNLVGYGFASPTVMSGLAVDDPSAYPLYHVQNTEDIVTRVGAQVHLGVCLMYRAGADLRGCCYGWSTDPAACNNRQLVARVFRHMQDTPTCIETTMAYLNVLASFKPEDMTEALGALGVYAPVKKLMNAADQRVDNLLRTAQQHMAATHVSIAGKPVDMQRVAEIQAEITEIVNHIGLKAFTNAQMELMGQPHRLNMQESGRISPYMYIARHGVEQLIPAIWCSGRPPRLVYASRQVGSAADVTPQAELFNRRMVTPQRRMHRHPKCALPRKRNDTRHTTMTLEPGSLKPGERIVHVK